MPMERLRVLSFGTAVAGNVCARLLAELGADVVKIESPGRPDPVRTLVFPDHPRTLEPTGAETTALYAELARSVRSLALDMSSEQGRDTFRRLVPQTDVVLENFRPGVLERWGLNWEALQSLNERVVLVSMSGFGATPPRSGYACYGANSSAFSGLTARSRVANVIHQDYVAAAHAAVATLAALAHRDRHGRGVWIDQAQTEAGAALMGPAFLKLLVDDHPERDVVEPVAAPLRGIFPCAGGDDWIAVEAETDDQLGALEALLREEDPEPPADTVEQKIPIARALERWTRNRRSHAALRRLALAGVPAGVVQRPGDLYRDPQLRAREAIIEVVHPDLGGIEQPAPPHRLEATAGAIRGPAPRLGEHTNEILSELLGLDPAELSGLGTDGVV